MAMAEVVTPTNTSGLGIMPRIIVTVGHDVRPTNHSTRDAANDRARRSGDSGTGTGTDGYAFYRSGLRCKRRRRKRQHNQSRFENSAHDKSPLPHVC
jgi:hypothetical protein